MSTVTGQILIGKAHPYERGINPEYHMYLSENGASKWTLYESTMRNNVTNPFVVEWLPTTLENMLEDAIIMIGIYVLKDNKLIDMAKKFISEDFEEHRYFPLFGTVPEEKIQLMRDRAKQIENSYKVTVSVFYGSSILRQVSALKEYKLEVEVCMPVYVREYSVFNQRVMEMGTLHTEKKI